MDTRNNTNIQIENLIFDGGDRTIPSAIGVRNGLNMNLGTNGNSWVRYCDFIGLNGIGVHAFEPGGVLSGQVYKVGFVDHCRSEFCGIGADQLEIGNDSCEYSQWTANEAVSCLVGVNKNAGNVQNIGWRISLCTTGIRLYAGINGNHGVWMAPVINHCPVALAATNFINGELFSGGFMLAGCQILLNACSSIEFNGMQLSGTPPIIIANTPPGGYNLFEACKFQGDWALCKQTITNDGGGIFLGNFCFNLGGVTNSSDGSFGNGSLVIKPTRYFLGSAQLGGGTAALSGQNFGPSPYFDADYISWSVSGAGGLGLYIPEQSINPCTNSIVTATILNTNTATITITNFAPVIMYFGNAGRQYVHPILSNTVTFAQGYNTLSWTNCYTNTSMTRLIGFEFGVGDHVQTGYLTKFVEQPIQ
jgi:hypothetical protein